ncbi:cysteinyl-tRNA synthetase, putative [Trypanosoma brucei gambiense DAL972]|uniref:cysteine--tRNA ligase n=1 Tax=Trypanosoma brucei gambiense (strain MHOM/CI/86/DAL972) TaxID=679716 RepID=C9ZQB2_TRYB9|nr:cysteinyl-tRNA synthetase, putative [Trypanosoma brucei gambiense DAL972]CBH11592.1 cysteinyl-tRNA synthetase, putative [Trypanosoma brucei gambiense DAL972]|eukprot:XP_011773877.1 cysteinyl-tRNA synthetase, putative [Trypanosoma brucei gambiense DAL972]
MKESDVLLLADGLNVCEPVKRSRHPPWYPPLNVDGNDVCVLNSMTECLEKFAPREGRLVRWYTCGPTVYDVSHMGHARAYLTFDILRRIMEDFFGYKVIYQMNITDIDDKIIKRARVSSLLRHFRDVTLEGGNMEKLVKFTVEAQRSASRALSETREKLSQALPEGTSSRVRMEREEKIMELALKETQFSDTSGRIQSAIKAGDFDELFDAASGINGDLLDQLEGHTVTDQKIFDDHARRYERLFFEDMKRLGVKDPDVITRVTEYVPQVVNFIQRIMDNGFAYSGETSVFFDTTAFIRAGHNYPKLKPISERDECNTTEAEMAEGEGALAACVAGEKRSPNDFALWKFSKPGEPHWPSPWGAGRPGWHIECSVMASDILGTNMDIHSGGCDLKFPHHDNECAQSEAYSMQHQWVNYFLHCGHLHIKGLKMSKSLKNFITIRHALDDLGVTPRTMRLLFLANQWNKAMNFSDQSIDEAKERERVLRSFFGSVDMVLRSDTLKEIQGFNEHDRKLNEAWISTESAVDAALRNNFDTPTAMEAIMGLVSETNRYLVTGQRPSATLVHKVGRYVTRILQVFGVVDGNDMVGFTKTRQTDDQLVPVMEALLRFRDSVRSEAKASGTTANFLPLCDAIRDEWLAQAGIRIEDSPNGPTTWKRDDPAVLLREISERREQQANDRRRKLQNQIETKKKLVEKWRNYTSSPKDYFKMQSGSVYATFDEETGLPTSNSRGEVVGEKELKKLSKELAKYAKAHEEFNSKGGMEWLLEQEQELANMEESFKSTEVS